MRNLWQAWLSLSLLISASCGDSKSAEDNRARLKIAYTGSTYTISSSSQLCRSCYSSASGLLSRDQTSVILNGCSDKNQTDESVNPRSDARYITAWVDANGDHAPSPGEPYTIYDHQTLTGMPTPAVFSAGAVIDVAFGDENPWTP